MKECLQKASTQNLIPQYVTYNREGELYRSKSDFETTFTIKTHGVSPFNLIAFLCCRQKNNNYTLISQKII